MIVTVNCRHKTIVWKDREYDCRTGQDGFIDGEKGTEGDGKTPLGRYRIRFGLYRRDKLPAQPPSKLNFWPMSPQDGWCDDVNDPAYNRFVRLPFEGSHEKLWREDGVYDIVLVIAHNDSPPIKGLGSAVFIHIAHIDDRQTLGCIAISPDVMIKLLKDIGPETIFQINA